MKCSTLNPFIDTAQPDAAVGARDDADLALEAAALGCERDLPQPEPREQRPQEEEQPDEREAEKDGEKGTSHAQNGVAGLGRG